MGLKNQPEFEAQEEDIYTPAPEASAPETATRTAEEAKPEQGGTAVAKAASTQVGEAKKFKVAFVDKNNVFDTQTVESLALATPSIKGEQGSIFMGDVDMGSSIHVELISFNHRWAIGSGENDAEAKDYFKVSYDNLTISGENKTVEDYVNELKAKGFKKAKKSPYMDLWVFVVWSEKNGHVPLEDRQLARLQCSQTSMGAFTAFSTTRGLLEKSGAAKPLEVIGVRAMKRVSGTNKYTNFEFFAPKP